MNRFACLLTLLLVSCDGAAEPDASRVQVTITEPSFTHCDCHHGFGPGIDGTARVSLRYDGPGAVHVVLAGVLVGEAGSSVVYVSNGAQPRLVNGKNVFHEGDLTGGAEVQGVTTAYIDPGTSPWPPSSTYVAGLDLVVDGVPQRIMSTTTFTMPYRP